MGNLFNNGPKILKLIVRVRIYHILAAWIFFKRNLKIYRSQTDFIAFTNFA